MKLIPNESKSVYLFWCPGCGCGHVYHVKAEEGRPGSPVWGFNGNMEKPTFTPSLLNWHDGYPAENIPPKRCHINLTDGIINYCGDCTHQLAGKSVPMEEIPATYGFC
jgi:hypothetical protein